MDIENRLNYLIKKRSELSKALNEQVVSAPINSMYTRSFDATELLAMCGKIRSEDIYVTLYAGCTRIVSSLSDENYDYVYFSENWRLDVLENEHGLSCQMNANDQNAIARPVIVFKDKNKKKISHAFFVLNTPFQCEVPERCMYIQLGMRIQGKGKILLRGVDFGCATLQQQADVQMLQRIMPSLEQIPDSNGCRYYEKYSGKIGIISDLFIFDAFKISADLVYITPDNYKSVRNEVDMLLVVSAWHGLNDEWTGMTIADSDMERTIFAVIDFYKKASLPVVFYSKEDPPNYEHFLRIAKRCDYVFTSAEEKIDAYRADCQTAKVESLSFGINPTMHNPIGMCSKNMSDGVIFSGSWMEKYPERTKSLTNIFRGVMQSKLPLKIVDRNFDGVQCAPRYCFPQEFFASISPAIAHDLLFKVHKLYRWSININSVTESHTMFANRVYELQANGNLLLSNHSVGMEEKFKDVFIAEDSETAADILTKYSKEQLFKHQVEGVRRVMTGETTFDRLYQITRAAGLQYEVSKRSVAVVLENPSAQLQSDFDTQTYRNCFCVTQCTDEALSDADIVAFWHSDFRYGPHYLEDMVNGFKYTACRYITKNVFENETADIGTEHNYVDSYRSKFATVFWRSDYSDKELAELPEASSHTNGYCIDRLDITKRSNYNENS